MLSIFSRKLWVSMQKHSYLSLEVIQELSNRLWQRWLLLTSPVGIRARILCSYGPPKDSVCPGTRLNREILAYWFRVWTLGHGFEFSSHCLQDVHTWVYALILCLSVSSFPRVLTITHVSQGYLNTKWNKVCKRLSRVPDSGSYCSISRYYYNVYICIFHYC